MRYNRKKHLATRNPMDLANLNAFIAIAEAGSFSEAAERLHLTQPAVSKRIAGLEQQYAQQRLQIERDLLAGCDELAKIKAEILKQRAKINIGLIRQAMQEAQAQADLRVFYPGPGALWRQRKRA